MTDPKVYTVIGLMSGTSVDGVDVALIKTDGLRVIEPLRFTTYPYTEKEREIIRAAFGKRGYNDIVEEAEAVVTSAHLRALKDFQAQADLIGFHGQTILHDPLQKVTWQIGDAQALARSLSIPVMAQMRLADVKAGGQGAPLLPLYHQARAEGRPRPIAVINIGGVSNITYLGIGDEVMACDCGPGNALIDDFMLNRLGKPFDQDGQMAAGGIVHEQLLTTCLAHPYFKKPLPKSLDRNQFEPLPPELSPQHSSLRDQDVVATLTAFTVESIVKSTELFPQRLQECLVTGGGRHNQTMMRGLSDRLGIPVYPVEHAGWQGDALEAEGFAYLAVRAIKGLPLTLPLTTGAPHPLTGGVLFHP